MCEFFTPFRDVIFFNSLSGTLPVCVNSHFTCVSLILTVNFQKRPGCSSISLSEKYGRSDPNFQPSTTLQALNSDPRFCHDNSRFLYPPAAPASSVVQIPFNRFFLLSVLIAYASIDRISNPDRRSGLIYHLKAACSIKFFMWRRSYLLSISVARGIDSITTAKYFSLMVMGFRSWTSLTRLILRLILWPTKISHSEALVVWLRLQ